MIIDYKIHHGDCLETLRGMTESSVDSIVTDPPYGLSKQPDMAEVLRHWLKGDDYVHTGSGFMGKSWDSFVPGPSVWREALRVLKPGGYALVFAGSRTQDLMSISLRLAGFEIRDTALEADSRKVWTLARRLMLQMRCGLGVNGLYGSPPGCDRRESRHDR